MVCVKDGLTVFDERRDSEETEEREIENERDKTKVFDGKFN